jgi:hypothetical protein
MAEMPVDMRITLTIAFLATGVFCLRRSMVGTGSGRVDERIGYGAHALMSGSMATMAWFPPWWAAGQMVVFALVGGRFAVRAAGVSLASLRRPLESAVPGPAPSAQVDGRGHRRRARLRCLHHALVMAAMVWMFRVMAPESTPMPAMTMTAGGSRASIPLLATIGGFYCQTTAALLLIGWASAVSRRRSTGGGYTASAREDLVYALMTAGTGTMLFTLA